MKRFLFAAIASGIAMAASAQDSTAKKPEADTIKIGGMIIIKKGGHNDHDTTDHTDVQISTKRKKNPNVSTNWWVVDLGFANYNDKTNYADAVASGFIAPGMTGDNFDLRTGKSVNVNIWMFMQRLNLIKHVVNLKYGLGVELNNYRFDDERVRFQKNPTFISLYQGYTDLKKNKLAADYVTVPMMLNFNLTPQKKNAFGFSAGVSAGYLYSARQKTKMGDNKEKLHNDFDLNKWKLSYVGEANFGPVKLYGSYAFKSMWEKGLDQTPYNVGLRFSNW